MLQTSDLLMHHLTMLSDEFGIFHTIAIRLLPMLLDKLKSIYYIIHSRFIRLLSTALSHPSSFIRSVFHEGSLVCNSGFIGYNINCMFNQSHCKSYSTDHVAVGHLIREI